MLLLLLLLLLLNHSQRRTCRRLLLLLPLLRLLQRLPVDGHSYYQKPEIEANVKEMITYLDLGYPRCARCAGPMHVSIVVGKLLEFLAVSIRHFAGFHFSF